MKIVKLEKLPKIPNDFIPILLDSFEYTSTDVKKSNQYNRFRQVMNRAAPFPNEIHNWIRKNIYLPYFSIEDIEKTVTESNNLINVTSHVDGYEGKHPIHVDISRNYALNYYWDTGGSNTKITWFGDDKKTIIYESEPILTEVWYLLKVRPDFHEVSGIESGKKRMFLTLGFLTEDLSDFNETEFFSALLSKDK